MDPASPFASDAADALADLRRSPHLKGLGEGVVERFVGEAPTLATPHRIVAAQAAAIAAVGAGAAQRWQQAGHAAQSVEIDALQAACSLHPPQFQRQSGHPMPILGRVQELKNDFYRTADGRWFFPVGSYPHLRDGVLDLLQCANTPAALAAAIARWQSDELEAAFAARGLAGTHARSEAEWAAHPQGIALGAQPVVAVERIGDGPAMPPQPRTRPLDDLRVLDASHVIAGPVAARTLAEHGADVLRISAPHQPDAHPQVLDTNIGKRSAFIDLRQPEDGELLRSLCREADVFVQSWRPGGLDRLGFGPADLARLRPGIVYLSVSTFGPTGPWAGRKGFEQMGQCAAGIAVAEGEAQGLPPRLVPSYLLNDYLTGYLGAAGVLAALRRRAAEGGSFHVRVALARSSMWVRALGTRPLPLAPQSFAALRPALVRRASAFGMLEQMDPVARLSATPACWSLPPAPLGSAEPVWLPR